MESLKRFEDICEPDERQKCFALIDPNSPGGPRPITLKDFYDDAEGIRLHEDVPEAIRSHFETARNLVIYSWFYYSEHDREFAERLHTDLEAKGVRCWLFSEDAKWGESVWGEIDRGIKLYDKLVVICSENSLQSPAVLREIERGLQREDREKKNVLFPIRIDDYIFEKWEHERKADVVKKVVGDFRKWKNHDAYQKAFTRLLKDLQATDSKKV